MELLYKGDKQFRFMTRDDLDEVMQIERSCYPFPWTKAIMEGCLRVGYVCLLLIKQQQIAGYTVVSHGAGECHLLNLCIAPDFQGKQYATLLLEEALGLARQLGAGEAYLEVRRSNQKAVNLYFKSGFNEIGMRKAYYPAENGREDAIVMARTLL